MTLIVSLRTSDGIVLAGDSLATMMSNPEFQGPVNVKCPECAHEHVTIAKIQATGMPATTFSYAQKVFPFMNDYGIGTFGAGQLMGRTMYFAIRELEKDLLLKRQEIKDVSEAAAIIGDYAHGLFKQQVVHDKVDIDTIPDDASLLGFQVTGYDAHQPLTKEVNIGKKITIKTFETPGATVSGQGSQIVAPIFQRYNDFPLERPAYEAFSLQDAIDYADFLINATASHQRFAKTMPGVGGSIDVALVTPFDHFKWIRQKDLFAKISEVSPCSRTKN